MDCHGNCGGCSGCGLELELTEPEIALLVELGQVAFLPVARTVSDPTPVYLCAAPRQQTSLVLECLEKKALISLDFQQPLKGFDYSGYENLPLRGSMALTQRGQLVLEEMEYQGIHS